MDYVMVPLRVTTCKHCGNPYVEQKWWDLRKNGTLKIRETLQKSGVTTGPEWSNWNDLCTTCWEKGREQFVCVLCGKTRSSSQEEESFGDPSEKLCRPCYESVPARKWDDTIERLREKHKWDFE